MSAFFNGTGWIIYTDGPNAFKAIQEANRLCAATEVWLKHDTGMTLIHSHNKLGRT